MICAFCSMRTFAAAEHGTLPLHECRLEHPLKITSVAARCGVLQVAENPQEPSGRMIGLHVAVVPALNRRSRSAPLFLLAGGPGQAASELYVSYAGAFARVNRNHDIVLLDQRGTGLSEPLFCDYPEDWRETRDELPALKRATLDCLARYGERVRYYTSSVAAQDLERVRAALGYKQIDLYGASYGTRMAELYLRRHAEAVQAVILDGVTDPEQAIGPATPFDAERALDLILERCGRTPECAAGYPALRADFGALRAKFGPASTPLTLPDPATGEPLELEFNHGVLAAALRLLSYNSTQASLLPDLIHQGSVGRLAALAAQTVMMARARSAISSRAACKTPSSAARTCRSSERGHRSATHRCDLPGYRSARCAARRFASSGRVGPWTRICTPPCAATYRHCCCPARPIRSPRLRMPSGSRVGWRAIATWCCAGEGHGQLATGCVPGSMAQFLDAARSASARCGVPR